MAQNARRKLTWLNLERMKHADIMAMFKDYYGEVLERSKTRIDNDGPLSQDKVLKINSALETIDELMEMLCN